MPESKQNDPRDNYQQVCVVLSEYNQTFNHYNDARSRKFTKKRSRKLSAQNSRITYRNKQRPYKCTRKLRFAAADKNC